MFLTQFFFAVLSKLSLCVSDRWHFKSNKQLNRGPKWKAPKLRAKQKQRALENLSETPTALSNRLTKGRHSVLGHHLVSSSSSVNDACLLFVESEFFWTFHVCWKASGRSIQVLLYVPCVFCLQRFVVWRWWSRHAMVLPLTRSFCVQRRRGKIQSTKRSQFLLAYTYSQKRYICTHVWRRI